MSKIGTKIYFGSSKKPHEIIEFRSHGEGKKTGVAKLKGPTGKITKAIKSETGKYKKMK